MKLLDSARVRLRLLFARRTAESRMMDEFRFHLEMETDQLMRVKGLAPDEARRQALAAFGGVEAHKEAMRDGRGLTSLASMSLDVKLGGRMMVKYPILTIAGGLALAIAIGVGAGWYALAGKMLWPKIPLPDGDRIVVIETQNVLTTQPELRVSRDFLEWRSDLRSIDGLGAYRSDRRNLTVGNAPPVLIRTAALTAAAFRTARVTPLIGRGLLDADERPGAPGIAVLGYDVWQRWFEGRNDVVGSIVKLGGTPLTVVGVMPEGFGYPLSYQAWTPLQLRASYGALEGDAIAVIGRLKPGITLEQANAELRVVGERAAAALPATHAHLRSLAGPLGTGSEPPPDIAGLAMMYLPSLLVLLLACTTVGTLFYARTAIREGEMAIRAALGASRARIIGQLFIEALVLAVIAAAVGLIAADRTLRWGIESVAQSNGGLPFWMTPGLETTTILYAGGLAVAGAAMLSLLPALRVTRTRLQSHLTNLGAGGSTLRFGRVWTTAMIAQVTLTAIAIPASIEGASQAILRVRIHARFPSHEYFTARLDFDRPAGEEMTSAFEERRTRTYARLEQLVAKEPDVITTTFADRQPGGDLPIERSASVEIPSGAGPAFRTDVAISSVGPGFFEAFDRPIVAGRGFHRGDFSPAARTVIVNEAFARGFVQRGIASPLGARLRYASDSGASAAEAPFEIVGVVRDLGLDPGEQGNETAYVFHATPAATVSPLVMSVRLRGNSATFAARLPAIAAGVDGGLSVLEARPLDESIWQRDLVVMVAPVAAVAGVSALVLFLSAMGLFSLMSISVSRRTREIGLRVALGANPRHVLGRIVAHAMVLMGSGVAVGGGVVLLASARGRGPSGRPADDLMTFSAWIALTVVVMLSAGLLACVEPARRALRISPSNALREA
jgi:putative ABC transport system permease protein